MIYQMIFLLGLHLFGVLFGLLFKKHIPFPFICITGFLWGALIWVVTAVLLLTISVAYSPMNMGLLLTVIIVTLIITHISRNTWQLNYTELAWLMGTIFVYFFVVSITIQFNYSWPTHDSAVQIMLGRVIAQDGYVYWPQAGIVSYGLFVPLLHSASIFLGQDYLWAVHPVFAFSFFLSFCYLCWHATKKGTTDDYKEIFMVLLISLSLFTAGLMFIQVFYIHNSFISATYLFIAVGSSWLALRDQNNAWLIFTMAALTGFSLARIEAPLFAIAFLSLLINTGNFSYKLRLYIILPYLIFMIIWYFKLMLFTHSYYDIILNPRNAVALLALLISFGAFLIGSRLHWVEHFVLPKLHILMIGVLLITLGVFFVQQPEHMLKCVINTIKNAYYYGNWGPIWIYLFVLLLLSIAQPRMANDTFISLFIIAFFLLLFSLGAMRTPYRLGYGDSGNRMLTHILPIICLYILIKHRHFYFAVASEKMVLVYPHSRTIFAIGGIILIIASLLWFIKIV